VHPFGSRDRQYLFLAYCVANAASEPAGNYPQNNTSGRDSEAEGEMLLCNPNNILFPCHLHQNNEAWNKSIQIPNPKLLQSGQLCEQKIKSQEGWVSFLSKRGSILVSAEVHIATLARTLNRWGFEFGKGTRSQHLKEKDHVVVARRKYLRKKRANWAESSGIETIRPEVYLDESYVNKNHSNDFIWYFGEDGPWVQKPTGNGERLIILNAITQSGWVSDAKLIFKSTRKTGDYHGQMNFELFKKWFTEMLIPNIPENSIIIMDNASYHNTLADHSPPTAQSSKEKICKWLDKNDVTYPDHCLKVELVELLTKQSPEPIYAIDEIAKSYGHEVIRTPPYHPELQPIEICWGVVKNHIARNCNFTMKNLIEQLGNGFDKVTSETCKKIIAKIRMHEDRFWSEDLQIDALETA